MAAIPRYQQPFGQIIADIVQFAGENIATRMSVELANPNLSGLVRTIVGSTGSFLSGFVLVLLYVPFLTIVLGCGQFSLWLTTSLNLSPLKVLTFWTTIGAFPARC